MIKLLLIFLSIFCISGCITTENSYKQTPMNKWGDTYDQHWICGTGRLQKEIK